MSGTLEQFLVFADSAVNDIGLSIKLQARDFSCDIGQHAIAT